jgi:Tfp pilus assembly protein PilO
MSITRRWVLLAAVAAVVVLAAGWLLLVKPQQSKVSKLHTETTQQNQANQLLLTQIAALQSEQKQLPQQQLALQKFSTEVPDSVSEPTLIRQLTTAAQHSGVELVSITPGAAAPLAAAAGSSTLAAPAPTTTGAAPAASLYQLPVSLAIVGSYANVEAFFSSLERLPRATLVTGFTVCPENTSFGAAACSPVTEPTNKVPPPGSVGATLSATVFYTPDVTTATATSSQSLSQQPASTTAAGTTTGVTGPSTTGAAAGATN